jgi:hypothetical protein
MGDDVTDTYNIKIRAGNSGTVENELGFVCQIYVADAPYDLTGQDIIFRVIDAAGQQVIRKDSDDEITVDIPTATITVPITVEDSRTLAAAPLRMRYEMERRFDSLQRTFLNGDILIARGVNDD